MATIKLPPPEPDDRPVKEILEEARRKGVERAHGSIRKAADADNPTARKMARSLDRDASRRARREGKGQRGRD